MVSAYALNESYRIIMKIFMNELWWWILKHLTGNDPHYDLRYQPPSYSAIVVEHFVLTSNKVNLYVSLPKVHCTN